jgi:hypothetical protein
MSAIMDALRDAQRANVINGCGATVNPIAIKIPNRQ